MIIVEEKEEIRRAYYINGKSIRQIHRETGHHRRTIRKALDLCFGYRVARRRHEA